VPSEVDVIWRLALALALSSAIGLEREYRQKAAGLRTYTLVGLGSALFMLVSQYGFADTLTDSHVILDPSRVAAQIVSGIGFICAGIIFVRRDSVRGLTTAAGIWLTAAVAAACAGDLPLLAISTTAAYFLVVFGYPAFMRRIPASRHAPSALRISYEDGRGVLRELLSMCTERGFAVADIAVERPEAGHDGRKGTVNVALEILGSGHVASLAGELGEIEGVVAVQAADVNEVFE
jgi:putative Mg2+ transporter-C (MgtC) family protein